MRLILLWFLWEVRDLFIIVSISMFTWINKIFRMWYSCCFWAVTKWSTAFYVYDVCSINICVLTWMGGWSWSPNEGVFTVTVTDSYSEVITSFAPVTSLSSTSSNCKSSWVHNGFFALSVSLTSVTCAHCWTCWSVSGTSLSMPLWLMSSVLYCPLCFHFLCYPLWDHFLLCCPLWDQFFRGPLWDQFPCCPLPCGFTFWVSARSINFILICSIQCQSLLCFMHKLYR